MAYKIEKDKWKHFFVGIPLGALLYFFSIHFFELKNWNEISLSFIALVIICYGFELLSLITGKGHADNLDAIAGIAGGIIGIFLVYLVNIFFN